MDGYQLIASIVSSISWPTTLCVIFFVLLKPIKSLLKNMKLFEYSGFKAEFRETLADVKIDLANSESSSERLDAPTDIKPSIHIENISPPLMVVDSWMKIEEFINRIMDTANLKNSGTKQFGSAIQILTDSGILDLETADMLRKLRHLRNEVVHLAAGNKIGYHEAQEYNSTAGEILARLWSIQKQLKQSS